jgi:hypothetical protein
MHGILTSTLTERKHILCRAIEAVSYSATDLLNGHCLIKIHHDKVHLD